MQDDPKTYDRADQFCARKSVGSPCSVPGNPFEGGGTGTCQTRLNDKQQTIDSLCTFGERREVRRNMPDRDYRGAEVICDKARRDPNAQDVVEFLVQNKITCGPTPTIPDQFCDGKAVGEACVAEMLVNGSISTYPGRCGEKDERVEFYSYGYRTRVCLI